MKLLLEKIDPKLRERIEKQIAEEDRLRVGGVESKVAQQKAQCALDGKSLGHEKRGDGVDSGTPQFRVTLVNFRKRLIDGDNLIGGCKPLRDTIASWLELDDNERFIDWEYHQVKSNNIGTLVKIEQL